MFLPSRGKIPADYDTFHIPAQLKNVLGLTVVSHGVERRAGASTITLLSRHILRPFPIETGFSLWYNLSHRLLGQDDIEKSYNDVPGQYEDVQEAHVDIVDDAHGTYLFCAHDSGRLRPCGDSLRSVLFRRGSFISGCLSIVNCTVRSDVPSP